MKCPHCQREYDELLIVTNHHGLCTFDGCLVCKEEFERQGRFGCGHCHQQFDELVLANNPRTGQRELLCHVCIQTLAAPNLEQLITTAA